VDAVTIAGAPNDRPEVGAVTTTEIAAYNGDADAAMVAARATETQALRHIESADTALIGPAEANPSTLDDTHPNEERTFDTVIGSVQRDGSQQIDDYTSDINNATAQALNMTRSQLRTAIHVLKDAANLGPSDNVLIHIPTGDAYFNGEWIGNLHDEY
jgi:hypothetical protein